MQLCIISDTHTQHCKLNMPNADVVIHCGDMTNHGDKMEIINFMHWFKNLNQYKHKICIAGNHDVLFHIDPGGAKKLIPDNVHYLQNTSIIIDGLTFYGTPATEGKYWAFSFEEHILCDYWSAIPSKVDVLITHAAPCTAVLKNVSKFHPGSISLFKEITHRINPKLHAFGHLHYKYGIERIDNTIYVNAALTDDTNLICRDPIIVEL